MNKKSLQELKEEYDRARDAFFEEEKRQARERLRPGVCFSFVPAGWMRVIGPMPFGSADDGEDQLVSVERVEDGPRGRDATVSIEQVFDDQRTDYMEVVTREEFEAAKARVLMKLGALPLEDQQRHAADGQSPKDGVGGVGKEGPKVEG